MAFSGPFPDGDVLTVRESEAVLPQQLALLPHHVSGSPQGQGSQDGASRAGIAVQTVMVSF